MCHRRSHLKTQQTQRCVGYSFTSGVNLPAGHLEAVVDRADSPARGPTPLQLLLPV